MPVPASRPRPVARPPSRDPGPADRLFRPPGVMHGAVVDWIHVSFYPPTFNLADVWLRGGILIAALAWLWTRGTRRTRPAQP